MFYNRMRPRTFVPAGAFVLKNEHRGVFRGAHAVYIKIWSNSYQ